MAATLNIIPTNTKQYLRDGRAPIPKKDSISRVMSANKAKNTSPELNLRKELTKIGIKGYKIHSKKIPGRPDISFTKKKIAIFINGCYWHRCPYCNLHLPKSNRTFWNKKFQANKDRDKRKNRELKKLKWRAITIWECQLKKNVEKQVNKVFKTLNHN